MIPKISHEVPKSLLDKNLSYSDYQYCLPHLMEEDDEYRAHFAKCKSEGIEIYLDNSIYELGESMSDDILLKWLDALQPSTFFVPDVWENSQKTIENAAKWMRKYSHNYPNTTFTAVVQASDFMDAIDCYEKFIELGYKKIAFSFNANWYPTMFPHPDQQISKELGRLATITTMYEMTVIKANHRIHLLGSANPSVFTYYKNLPFIESIDTSNPVMAAIDKTQYPVTLNISKPVACLNTRFDIPLEHIDMWLIDHNVEQFKQIFA